MSKYVAVKMLGNTFGVGIIEVSEDKKTVTCEHFGIDKNKHEYTLTKPNKIPIKNSTDAGPYIDIDGMRHTLKQFSVSR